MNTKTKNVYIKFIVAIIIFCACGSLRAQRLVSIKNTCGLYYRTIHDLEKQQRPVLKFYQFRPHDTIASIGAQACNWEAAYAAVSDSTFFYLEDIDTTYCNFQQASMAWQYYGQLKGDKMTSDFAVIMGDEKSTHLAQHSCDKILIINSFHEFTYPAEMLKDIAGKLKPAGTLYIDETLASYTGELHVACNKRMYTETELIQFVEKNGFIYKNSITLAYYKRKPGRKIFAFTRKNG